jgi:hypothetical protein
MRPRTSTTEYWCQTCIRRLNAASSRSLRSTPLTSAPSAAPVGVTSTELRAVRFVEGICALKVMTSSWVLHTVRSFTYSTACQGHHQNAPGNCCAAGDGEAKQIGVWPATAEPTAKACAIERHMNEVKALRKAERFADKVSRRPSPRRCVAASAGIGLDQPN